MGMFSKSKNTSDGDVPIATALPVLSSDAAASLPPSTMNNSDANAKARGKGFGAAAATATGVAGANNKGMFNNNNNNQSSVVYDLGRNPVCMDCPNCGAKRVSTKTKTYPGWETWACGVGIALVFWPVCWIPLILDSCKQTDHHCIQCGEKVGEVKPMADCCFDSK